MSQPNPPTNAVFLQPTALHFRIESTVDHRKLLGIGRRQYAKQLRMVPSFERKQCIDRGILAAIPFEKLGRFVMNYRAFGSRLDGVEIFAKLLFLEKSRRNPFI